MVGRGSELYALAEQLKNERIMRQIFLQMLELQQRAAGESGLAVNAEDATNAAPLEAAPESAPPAAVTPAQIERLRAEDRQLRQEGAAVVAELRALESAAESSPEAQEKEQLQARIARIDREIEKLGIMEFQRAATLKKRKKEYEARVAAFDSAQEATEGKKAELEKQLNEIRARRKSIARLLEQEKPQE